MYLPEACLGSLAPSPLHTIKSYTHMNPCHALFNFFFFWEKKKLSQPKIEHFSALKKKQHSWEFRQIVLVRRCLTDTSIVWDIPKLLQYPLMWESVRYTHIVFHPLCRIKSEALSLVPHLPPWGSVAALQKDYFTGFVKRKCLLNKIWCRLEHKPYPAIATHNNWHWYFLARFSFFISY